MSETRYFEEYRAKVLETLGVEDVDIEDLRDFVRWRTKVLEGLGEDPMTESDIRNFEKWRYKVLEALGVTGITTDDTRNFANWRRKVLEGLDVDGFTEEDVRNYEKWRLKVIEGLENMSPSGTVSGDIVTFVAKNNTVIKSLVVSLEPIQEGTGDPSPTNVRPISGWDEVNVEQRGKNLLDTALTTQTVNGTTFKRNADGSITISGTPSAQTRVYLYSGAYWDGKFQGVFSCGTMPSGTRIFTQKTARTVTYPTISPSNTLSSGAEYKNMLLEVNTSYSGTAFTIYPQLELGTTPTAYEPYQGETHSIPFKDSEDNPITVYGGEVDVVSGEGESTFGLKTFVGDQCEGWVAYPSYNGFLATGINMKSGTRQAGVCDTFKTSYSTGTGQTNACWFGAYSSYFFLIGVYDTVGSTVDELKTYLSAHPITVAYPLATPTPIYCEPTEIKTLKGNNTLWSDGDITVVYGKGTKEGGD